MTLICNYNTDSKHSSQHGQFIDVNNKILYLFGSWYENFCALNLETNEIINNRSNQKLYPLKQISFIL